MLALTYHTHTHTYFVTSPQGSSLFAELQQRKIVIDRAFVGRFRQTIQAHRDALADAVDVKADTAASNTNKRGVWNMWRSRSRDGSGGSSKSGVPTTGSLASEGMRMYV